MKEFDDLYDELMQSSEDQDKEKSSHPTDLTKDLFEETKEDPTGADRVDDDLYKELIGDSANSYQLDKIDNLYDEIMEIPDAAPIPETDLETFAEPVLLGMRKRSLEAKLAEPFSPSASLVTLHPASDCPRTTFELKELDYLGLVGIPAQCDLSQETVTEMVETFGGRTEEVEVPVNQKIEAGIFCHSSSLSSRFQYIFFPYSSIRFRYQTRLIGEILVDSGLVTKQVLQEVLANQQKMRSLRIGQILAKRANLDVETIETALRKAWRDHPEDKKVLAGEILVQAGLATSEQVEEALKIQKNLRKKKIGDMLIEQGHVDEDQVYSALAVKFRKSFVKLQDVVPADEASSALPRELVLKLKVFPLSIDNGRLILATANPEMRIISDILHKELSCPFELVVAAPTQLKSAIIRKYSN